MFWKNPKHFNYTSLLILEWYCSLVCVLDPRIVALVQARLKTPGRLRATCLDMLDDQARLLYLIYSIYILMIFFWFQNVASMFSVNISHVMDKLAWMLFEMKFVHEIELLNTSWPIYWSDCFLWNHPVRFRLDGWLQEDNALNIQTQCPNHEIVGMIKPKYNITVVPDHMMILMWAWWGRNSPVQKGKKF